MLLRYRKIEAHAIPAKGIRVMGHHTLCLQDFGEEPTRMAEGGKLVAAEYRSAALKEHEYYSTYSVEC